MIFKVHDHHFFANFADHFQNGYEYFSFPLIIFNKVYLLPHLIYKLKQELAKKFNTYFSENIAFEKRNCLLKWANLIHLMKWNDVVNLSNYFILHACLSIRPCVHVCVTLYDFKLQHRMLVIKIPWYVLRVKNMISVHP